METGLFQKLVMTHMVSFHERPKHDVVNKPQEFVSLHSSLKAKVMYAAL